MKAIVLGATGLVGKEIVSQLLNNPEIQEVSIFARRTTGVTHSKLKEHIINFENINSWSSLIVGDVLFSALGTTLKAAGDQKAQYRVDHDYQFEVARAAVKNGVKSLVVISSTGASAKSPLFYLKMKGELEDHLRELLFASIYFLRPGPLKGHREKSRLGEIISTAILGPIPKKFLPKGFIPVDGSQVAKIAIQHGLGGKRGVHVIEADMIPQSF